jgi:hypothetical protein
VFLNKFHFGRPLFVIKGAETDTTVGLWAIYYCVGSGSGISHFVEDGPGRLVLDFSKVMLWNGVGGERVGHTWLENGVVVPMGARCRYVTVFNRFGFLGGNLCHVS